jgi:hypothetical protein
MVGLWLIQNDDPPTPQPPGARLRIAEAVIIAALSATAGKIVEFFYEEFKERRRARKTPPQ